ncbi:MAG: hypothetical protein ACR2N4_01670 [Jatrophihabitans sp.]
MPELIEPAPRVAESFRVAMADFAAEGRGRLGDDTALGRQIREFSDRWHTDEGLAEFIESLRRAGDPNVAPPLDWVHTSTFWWVAGPRYLGSIRIRHNLAVPATSVTTSRRTRGARGMAPRCWPPRCRGHERWASTPP